MAAKKKTERTVTLRVKPGRVVFTTQLTRDTHTRLKVAAAHHRITIAALVDKGILMALGDL